MPRLRRSDLRRPGITRRRDGETWTFLDLGGDVVTDAAVVARCTALVLPPAWADVWICPWPNGHIQAVGTDAAGRRQYRYHDAWRQKRDQAKHERILTFAEHLPAMREQMQEDLRGTDLTKVRVLATAARLLDLGFFRIGSEEYAEANGTYGLATILRSQVTISGGVVSFDYPAKHSKQREQSVADDTVLQVVSKLRRRRGGGQELLAYRETPRGPWRDVKSADINSYLRELSGSDCSAKDFRTWHATVLMAVALAVSPGGRVSEAAHKRAVSRAVSEVSHYLGNTPAVARASYIDPRVVDLYDGGMTVAADLDHLGEDSQPGDLATQGEVEQAVLRMLRRA